MRGSEDIGRDVFEQDNMLAAVAHISERQLDSAGSGSILVDLRFGFVLASAPLILPNVLRFCEYPGSSRPLGLSQTVQMPLEYLPEFPGPCNLRLTLTTTGGDGRARVKFDAERNA
ncbi:hypothetical protein [Phaffia rhodozyma]|uniref:Uncharacterized protein n=1 Tax=Phaffia rhodozyma TaxID=264483 RepID=A0A0F7SRC1_PHARH|nr:hypothetical protein [Phaffia rhodozyma]